MHTTLLSCNPFPYGKLLLAAALLSVATLPARADWPSATNATKWVQYPDLSPSGYDVQIRQPLVLASDFLCTNTAPVTDIHIWASYLNNNVPNTTNLFLTVAIWSNVPPVPPFTNYNQPGALLWYQTFNYTQYLVRLWVTNTLETFWNPSQGTNVLGTDNAIFQYNFYPTNPFVQTGTPNTPITYWLSVSATLAGLPLTNIGWKTTTNFYGGSSLYAFQGGPQNTNILTAWNQLANPINTNLLLDLSFALTTTNPPGVIPTNTTIDKWLQVPEANTNGIDVRVTDVQMLADDFRCNATGPITEIRLWGSWEFDQSTQACFNLGLWTDIPTNQFNPYSQPGLLLCSASFCPGQYAGLIYTNVFFEKFWDPQNPGFFSFDSQVWEYIFTMPTNTCWYQTNGSIYWLSLTVSNFDQSLYHFGWKTCPTNWNDDAVFGFVPGFGWQELRRPPLYTNSMDLSFEIITSGTNQPPPPNTTNAYKWLQVPDPSTSGLDVKASSPSNMLADDFLCTATGPLTQIRLWASWLSDQLPPTPPCICLGLWTDIPRNGNNYSRPGFQLCGYCFQPNEYFAFPYTNGVFEQFYDPTAPGNGIIGTDTVIWEYVFNLPTNMCWYQTNGNIYWLSVQASCSATNPFFFGWKTCPTNWNDDAVVGMLPGFNWVDLHRPGFTNSLDLSFEIITSNTNLPCPPPTLNCLPDKTVQCGLPWVFDQPFVMTNCCGTNFTLTSSAYTNNYCPRVATITWILTDCYGQSAFCSQRVTILDFDPPIVGCPPNKTVQCGSAWTFDPPTAFDICCGTNVSIAVTGTFTNGAGCNFTATRNWTISDCCSNQTGCSQIVTVIDTTPPSIMCVPNKTVQCTNAWTFDQPMATDLCCGTNVTVSVASTVTNGQPCTGMTFTRIWQAMDCCNNPATCTQIVTLPPVTAPAVVCSTNKYVVCGSGWTFDPPMALGTCCTNLNLTVLSTVTNQGCGYTNVIVRSWLAQDCCSNSMVCTQAVTVYYTNPPMITCASNKTVSCSTNWSFDPPMVVDACCGTNYQLTFSDQTNGCSISRTWVVASNCGLSPCGSNIFLAVASYCIQTVTLLNTNKPSLVCPTNIVVLTCSSNIAVNWSINATGACGSVTVTSTPPSGTLFNRDTTNTVVATATACGGTTNSCSFQVIVRRPTLNIAISPGMITVSWADGGILQEATSVTTGIWTDLGVSSPYVVVPTGTNKFYRLKCP